MAKRRGRRSGRRSRKIPILATVGALAYAGHVYSGYKQNGVDGIASFGLGYTNGRFNLGDFVGAVAPVVVGTAASAGASKLGLNRYLAKVPLFKL